VRLTSKMFIEHLEKPPRACSDAIDFCRGKSPKKSWDTCERGDWMLWEATHAGVDSKLILTAMCKCVRPVLLLVKDADSRPPRIVIETIEAYVQGDATIGDVRIAACAIDDDAAAHIVHAAANAVDAAHAAHVTYAAAHVANAATHAAHAAAYTKRKEASKLQAKMVREVISYKVIHAALVKKIQEAKP